MSRALIARLRLDYPMFQLDVDLILPGAGITVLFGHSGSGKTTLLRCLAGLQRASSGFVEIGGRVWQDSDRDFFLPPHRRNLGYVFQDATLFPHLSVDGNVRFGLNRTKEAATDREIAHILALLGIEHLLSRMPHHLSGGERQRVAIARALVLKPSILLMDEPLASLDGKRKQDILPFLANLNREFNIPVLYVTHAQQEVAQLADHVVIMADGHLLAQGGLMQTLNRLDLPYVQEREACSVWQVEVLAHDADYRLTHVGCLAGELSLPHIDVLVGRSLRVLILARDVSVALQAPVASSILNVLPATISDIIDLQDGHTVLSLTVGDQSLLAHVTRKSAVQLDLRIGMRVFAQIKATSIVN